MPELNSEFLMTLRIELDGSHMVGAIPQGTLRVDYFSGGTFSGPKVNGVILPGGSDALLRRADDAMQPDVRLTLKTDDDALIWITYRGVRHGPLEVMARIAAGDDVAPSEYYLRNTPYFHTPSLKYDWLNRIVSVGVGRREPDAAVYDIHEIL